MKRNEHGGAAVETALILPYIILIMIAIAEFGNYFLTSYRFQQAVFTGARSGSIAQVNKAQVARNETVRMLRGMGIQEEHIPQVDVDSTLTGPVDGKTVIRVSIDTPHEPLIGISGIILPERVTATASEVNY